jgi:hypothetical protein
MIPDWTALDGITYALKEDELAKKIGRKKAKKQLDDELAERRMIFLRKLMKQSQDLFDTHTHSIPMPVIKTPAILSKP